MNRLQQALRNAAVDGVVKLSVALSIAKRFDQDEEKALQIIGQCNNQVGTILREDIAVYKSQVAGILYNPNDWDMSDKNGEQ